MTTPTKHRYPSDYGKRAAAPQRAKAPLPWRILKVLYIIVFVLALIIVAVYVAFQLFIQPPEIGNEVIIRPGGGSSSAAETAAPISSDEPALVFHRQEGVYTCLLLGVADYGGSDTIMLGVFDTKGKTASLISIPRDTLVNVNGDRKINSTYSLGGAELVAETVSSLLAVPIDYYVTVDFEGFAAIVDEIGGVWFDVPPGMDYEDPDQNLAIHISPGYQKLNGKDAVGVMRCRSAYITADIGRVETQRRFLAALVSQTITLSNVTKVTSLINTLNTYVDTDMPLDKMVYFATQAIGMDLESGLASTTLPGTWDTNYSVYQLYDDQVLELVNTLNIYEEEIPSEALVIRHK